jgi:hypothetical protein
MSKYTQICVWPGTTLEGSTPRELEDFFSKLVGDSPLSSIEFFEDLSDDYNFERTWDIPDQWIWKFDDPKDLEDLLNDYNLPKDDLKYI